MGHLAFCDETYDIIVSKLPYGLQVKAYDDQNYGQPRLENLGTIVAACRLATLRRAVAKSNLIPPIVSLPAIHSSSSSPPSPSVLKRRRRRRKKRPNTSVNAIPSLMSIVIADSVKNAVNFTSRHDTQDGLSVLPTDKLLEYTGDDAARVAALQCVPHLADCHGAARDSVSQSARSSYTRTCKKSWQSNTSPEFSFQAPHCTCDHREVHHQPFDTHGSPPVIWSNPPVVRQTIRDGDVMIEDVTDCSDDFDIFDLDELSRAHRVPSTFQSRRTTTVMDPCLQLASTLDHTGVPSGQQVVTPTRGVHRLGHNSFFTGIECVGC